MFEIFRFPFIKTIASRRYNKAFGLGESPIFTEYNQDFIFNIKFGNILKCSGDILLCPLSEDFKPSNPLSRRIIEKEGKWLKQTIEKLYTSEHPQWIGSEHVAFLPCRKLKYRGLLFVSVDFYSENRENINTARIAEALEVAAKYNCQRLTCPENVLYTESQKHDYDYIFYQWNSVINSLKDAFKIEFVIETLVQKKIASITRLQDSVVYYNFRNADVEYLPACSQILPHFRKHIKYIRTVYSLSARTAYQIRQLLTSPIKESKANRLFKKLHRIMGEYDESSVCNCNEGFEFFILGLCKEMPWNFFEIAGLLFNFPFEEGFNEFILAERFSDISKFEYRSKQ